MSYSFEQLKELGSKTIHIDTHITVPHIEAILNEDFEAINKVQMFGFLSIIEKTYSLDLSHIRDDAKEYYRERDSEDQESGGVFVIAAKNKKSSFIYIFIILIIFGTVAYFSLDATSKENVVKFENRVIEEVKKNINLVKDEKEKEIEPEPIVRTQTPKKEIVEKKEIVKPAVKEVELDLKVEVVAEEEKEIVAKREPKVVKKEKIVDPSLLIIPNTKVWVGYINITKNRRYQKIISEEFSLDPKYEWLMILGHSNLSFKLNGKKVVYKNRKSLRLSYKDNKLKEVTLEEFKTINRGKKW
ncbi:MAG: hypothetical protein U9P38_02010 [Campylobacterota bacterium]|nr:hypothetical protein [Campylobacterota bacterium]